MKIENIYITRMEFDDTWDESGEKFLGIEGVTYCGWGSTKDDTSVRVSIKATPAELKKFRALFASIEARVNRDAA